MSAASGLEHLKPFLPGLESALEDSEVSEIMINGPGNVWVERAGRLAAHAAPDLDEAALERAAIHIARPLGLDPSTSPIVDALLDDGSRVDAVGHGGLRRIRAGLDPRTSARGDRPCQAAWGLSGPQEIAIAGADGPATPAGAGWRAEGPYIHGDAKRYPTLARLIGGSVNVKRIRAHWDAILRLAASIQQGTVTASLILRKLGSYPRQNGLALALRELGRIERTLFTLDWLQDIELRRRVQIGLNKGEAKNALARAVFFNRLGELRDRSFENQRYRASGLNLVVAAIVLWNTAYLERVVQALRDTGNADDSLLPHLSPLGWEHINLTGDYSWQQNKQVEQGNFRPLPPLTRP